ncbi:unnamed protein product, partial [Oppiella nova]
MNTKDEYESASRSSEYVREGALEEGPRALRFGDFAPTVDSTPIHALIGCQSRLHHHSTSHSIEGVGDYTRYCRHCLCDHPRDHERSVLRVRKHTLRGVEESK